MKTEEASYLQNQLCLKVVHREKKNYISSLSKVIVKVNEYKTC